MNAKETTVEQAPARAQVRAKRASPPLVWLVPILAALGAGLLMYDHMRDQGPTITIRFDDGAGLQAGQTQIKYRGVPVGTVTALELTPDHQQVIAHADLLRSAAPMARSGTQFWIVRPEIRGVGVSGLATVLTGPEIQIAPGKGNEQTDFIGLEGPLAPRESKGLRIVLRTSRLGSLKEGTAILYRGVPVGEIQSPQLSDNATAVDLLVLIKPRYAPLVRPGSHFWNVSGVSVHASLFHGIDFKMDSLASLVGGGIALATPGGTAKTVADGTVFPLEDGPQKSWLQWSPEIKLPVEGGASAGAAGVAGSR
ncbi:MAG: MlaD family protein [Acidobacteriota bacterium]